MPDTPTSLMQQQLILRLLKNIPPCKVLEIGVGEGNLLAALARLGYWGTGIDLSPRAVESARNKLRSVRPEAAISVRQEDLFEITDPAALVLAFEVLEHIEDDRRALRRIFDLTDPGGHFLLSVPAHTFRWGTTDEIAGHIRRYEREDLREKLISSGFSIARFWSYGYPLANWLKPLRDGLNGRRLTRAGSTPNERTRESGVARVVAAPDAVYRLLFNQATLLPFYLWQGAHLESDLGDGYLVAAQRPA